MKNLVSLWNAVSEETIIYCFKKDNIRLANQQTALTDANDPFKVSKKGSTIYVS